LYFNVISIIFVILNIAAAGVLSANPVKLFINNWQYI